LHKFYSRVRSNADEILDVRFSVEMDIEMSPVLVQRLNEALEVARILMSNDQISVIVHGACFFFWSNARTRWGGSKAREREGTVDRFCPARESQFAVVLLT
jgi:hypothetical protein